jgi:hypothetical protein
MPPLDGLVVLSAFSLFYVVMVGNAVRTGVFNLRNGGQVLRVEQPLYFWSLVGFFSLTTVIIWTYAGFVIFDRAALLKFLDRLR